MNAKMDKGMDRVDVSDNLNEERIEGKNSEERSSAEFNSEVLSDSEVIDMGRDDGKLEDNEGNYEGLNSEDYNDNEGNHEELNGGDKNVKECNDKKCINEGHNNNEESTDKEHYSEEIKNFSGEVTDDKEKEQNPDYFAQGTGSIGNIGKGLKVPVPVILFLGTIIIISIFSMIRFPGVLKDYRIYKNAEERIKNGETSATLSDLYYLVEKYPDSVPVIMKAIKYSLENGYYDYAGYIIDTYLVNKSLPEDDYEWVKSYIPFLDEYYRTLDRIDTIFSHAENINDDAEYSLYIINNLKKMLNDKDNINSSVVNYYLGLFEYNTENSINYLMDCYNEDPECFDVRAQLANRYRRAGDFETALKFINEALAKDKMDSGALRAMSIIYMLKGEMEKGVEKAREAYNYYPDGLYVRETYMIALYFNGNMEEAEELKNEIIEMNWQLDEDTISLLNGEITLEEYYLDNPEGEVQV